MVIVSICWFIHDSTICCTIEDVRSWSEHTSITRAPRISNIYIFFFWMYRRRWLLVELVVVHVHKEEKEHMNKISSIEKGKWWLLSFHILIACTCYCCCLLWSLFFHYKSSCPATFWFKLCFWYNYDGIWDETERFLSKKNSICHFLKNRLQCISLCIGI